MQSALRESLLGLIATHRGIGLFVAAQIAFGRAFGGGSLVLAINADAVADLCAFSFPTEKCRPFRAVFRRRTIGAKQRIRVCCTKRRSASICRKYEAENGRGLRGRRGGPTRSQVCRGGTDRDLVDSVLPGDVVTVAGIVRSVKCDSKKGSQCTLYQLFHRANVNSAPIDISVDSMHCDADSEQSTEQKHSKFEVQGQGVVEFAAKDFAFLNRVINESDPLKLLVHSLCPSIFGHELVKAGLLLAMFGGNTKNIGSSGLATNVTNSNSHSVHSNRPCRLANCHSLLHK